MDFMRCLYWNSALHTPLGTLVHVNEKKPQGIWIPNNSGGRLMYGNATHLIACYVKDLKIGQDESGNMVLEWTEPPVAKFDNKTHHFLPVTKPRKRTFVWKPKI